MQFVDIEACPKCSKEKTKHATRYVYETVSTENRPTEIFVDGIQRTSDFLEKNISTTNSLTKALQQKVSSFSKNLSGFHDGVRKDNESDNINSFLSSDAWFSWDKKINLRKSLQSNEQIKYVINKIKSTLIDNTDILELPKPIPKFSPPKEPQKRKIQENIIEKISNVPPVRPLEPQKPESQSWSSHFKMALIKYAVFSVIIALFIAYLAPTEVGVIDDIKAIWKGEYISPLTRKIIVFIAVCLPLLVVNFPMAFISAFFGNKKLKNKYINDMKEYDTNLDKYNTELSNYESNQKQKKKEQEAIEKEYEEMMVEYRKNLEKLEKEYHISVNLHNKKVTSIKEERLELWNRLRVCQSCSHVFLVN
ncbi:hypothetical protein D5125_17020 [Magnetovirga frankeli]|uniref:hypothetical protein n=1 Tax=Magnetovirga frankeli TaxID=947516 RepID=UPI0012937A48|nr:hypothetical protein D5125_17020 [gamma proteobacterium SS-5]